MSKKIILASGSPRRKELLTLAGVKFKIVIPDVDETPKRNEDPQKMVMRLSLEKAKEVWRNCATPKQSLIIIAADTTVVSSKNKILGKPANKKEACSMINSLQGSLHHVYTGYSIVEITKGELTKEFTRSIETKVYIKSLSMDEISNYVSKGESLDKAGGYAAQGFGMTLIEKIEGSYTNVVGLPMAQVLEDLKQMGLKF